MKSKIPWNKGKKGLQKAWNKGLTKKTSKIMLQVSKKMKGQNTGKHPKKEFPKGYVPWNKGKTGLQVAWNKGLKTTTKIYIKKGRPSGNKHWRWRGGEEAGVTNHYSTAKWKRIRLSILKRDNNTCRVCGSLGYEVHHIVPYRFSKSDDPKNLITVCRPCHVNLENKIKNNYLEE